MAKLPLREMIAATVQDATPPLYYFLLNYWIKLFGSGEVSMRFLSFLPHLFTAIVIYLTVKFFAQKRLPAVVAGLLTFFNPLLFYYAFEARNYSLLVFLTALSYFFLLRKKWRFYSLSILFALYTHNFFLLVLAAQLITVFVFYSKREKLKCLKFLTAVFVLYLPWLPVLLKQFTKVGGGFWIEDFSFPILLREISRFFTGYGKYDTGLFFKIAVISFYAYSLFAGFIGRDKKAGLIYLLLIWLVFPLFVVGTISIYKPLFISRYLIYSVLPIILLAGFFWQKIWEKNNLQKIILAIFTLLFVCLSVYRCLYIFTSPRKVPIKAAVAELKADIDSSILLVNSSALTFFETKYYLSYNDLTEVRNCIGKYYEKIPFYVGKTLISTKDVCPNYKEAEKYFFIKNNGEVESNFAVNSSN